MMVTLSVERMLYMTSIYSNMDSTTSEDSSFSSSKIIFLKWSNVKSLPHIFTTYILINFISYLENNKGNTCSNLLYPILAQILNQWDNIRYE